MNRTKKRKLKTKMERAWKEKSRSQQRLCAKHGRCVSEYVLWAYSGVDAVEQDMQELPAELQNICKKRRSNGRVVPAYSFLREAVQQGYKIRVLDPEKEYQELCTLALDTLRSHTQGEPWNLLKIHSCKED